MSWHYADALETGQLSCFPLGKRSLFLQTLLLSGFYILLHVHSQQSLHTVN